MDKAALRNFFRPVIIVFILINAVCICFGKWLDEKRINHAVLIYANLILFIITLIACYIHIKSLTNNNPHAFVTRQIQTGRISKKIVDSSAIVRAD